MLLSPSAVNNQYKFSSPITLSIQNKLSSPNTLISKTNFHPPTPESTNITFFIPSPSSPAHHLGRPRIWLIRACLRWWCDFLVWHCTAGVHGVRGCYVLGRCLWCGDILWILVLAFEVFWVLYRRFALVMSTLSWYRVGRYSIRIMCIHACWYICICIYIHTHINK